MADKEYDLPSKRGVAGLKNRFTKPAEDDGKSYLGVMTQTAKRAGLWTVPLRVEHGPDKSLHLMPVAAVSMAAMSLPLSMAMTGSLDYISPNHGAYDQAFSQEMQAHEEQNTYRAVSIEGERYVLVEDENDTWRIYEYENRDGGANELRFVSDRFQAEAITKKVSMALDDTVEAYENFAPLPDNMPQEMRPFSVSMPYEQDGEIFRAVSTTDLLTSGPQNIQVSFTEASDTWQEASNEIAAGGYGFAPDSTPVDFASERPDKEFTEVAPTGVAVMGGSVLFLAAFASAFFGVGALGERYMDRRPVRRARRKAQKAKSQKARGLRHGG